MIDKVNLLSTVTYRGCKYGYKILDEIIQCNNKLPITPRDIFSPIFIASGKVHCYP